MEGGGGEREREIEMEKGEMEDGKRGRNGSIPSGVEVDGGRLRRGIGRKRTTGEAVMIELKKNSSHA